MRTRLRVLARAKRRERHIEVDCRFFRRMDGGLWGKLWL